MQKITSIFLLGAVICTVNIHTLFNVILAADLGVSSTVNNSVIRTKPHLIYFFSDCK